MKNYLIHVVSLSMIGAVLSVSLSPNCNSYHNCLTLDQLAQGVGNMPDSDIDITLMPGTHQLSHQFAIDSKATFTMVGLSDTIIACSEYPPVNGWFKFCSITMINITGINFANCVGITFVNSPNINILMATFTGYHNYPDSIFFNHSNAVISRTIFSANTVTDNVVAAASTIQLNSVKFTQCNCSTLTRLRNSTISLSNCTYDNNYGIVLVNQNSSLILDNSSFMHNKGGAIKIINSKTSISYTTFENNSALAGGAVDASESNIMLSHCLFVSNSATRGGALNAYHSNVSSNNVSYVANVANIRGGGVYAYQSRLNLTHNKIYNNSCKAGGGGIYIGYYSQANIVSSSFFFNSAVYGAAVNIYHHSQATLSAGVFSTNHGIVGGPLYMETNSSLLSSSLTIENNIGGILFGLNCNIYLKGDNHFADNYGNVLLQRCDVEMDASTVITRNMPYTLAQREQSGIDYDMIRADYSPAYSNSKGVLDLYSSHITSRGQLVVQGNNMSGMRLNDSTADLHDSIHLADNDGSTDNGGGLFTYQSTVRYYGSVSVVNNTAERGGAIYTGASKHQMFSQDVVLASNRALVDGGGMFLELHSKLDFFASSSKSKMTFSSNMADSKGGALYVNDVTYFSICNSTPPSQAHSDYIHPEHECFFQVYSTEQSRVTPHQTHQAIMEFTNNTASSGEILYGGMLDRCILRNSPDTSPLSILQLQTNELLTSAVRSDPMQLCLCTAEGVNCALDHITREIFRGENMTLNLTVVDEVNRSVEAVVYAQLSKDGGDRNGLNRDQSLQEIQNSCTVLTYNVYSAKLMEVLYLNPLGPCNEEGISRYAITLILKPCPLGFQLSVLNTSCECDSLLKDFNLTCDIQTLLILRHDDFWLGYTNTSNNSDLLIHPHCPYDYCYPPSTPVYVHLQSEEGPDSQCAFNRTGMLCGACRDGYSNVLGSSRCKKCSNKFLALIIPIALAGVILVILILFLNLTVDVGSINGPLLYANIVGIYFSALYPTGYSTYYSSMILSWINLDLGMETCFFDGLDMYIKWWLELLFVAHVLSMGGLILLLKYRLKSYYTSKLLLKTNPTAVMATLLLLVYTKCLRLIATALSYATVRFPTHTQHVWLADGTVPFFHSNFAFYSKHLVLLIATFFLILYVLLYTTLLLTSQWLMASNKKAIQAFLSGSKLRYLLKVYHCPHTPLHKHWTGVLLLFRTTAMVTQSVTTPTKHHQLSLLLLVVSTYLIIVLKDILGKTYVRWKLDLLETFQLINIGILATLSLFISDPTKQVIVSSTSAHIATLTLLLVVCHHAYTKLRKSPVLSRLCHSKCLTQSEQSSTLVQDTPNDNTQSISMSTFASTTVITIS